MAPAEIPAEAFASLAVEVLYCPQPGQTDSVQLCMPPGSTLSQALHASGLLARHGLLATQLQVGIWSRERSLDTVLRDRDRVEIYRPLQVDPKEARRQRYSLHKARVNAEAKPGAKGARSGAPGKAKTQVGAEVGAESSAEVPTGRAQETGLSP